MTTNALAGEPLPVYGDGRQIRDWLWVEDHCAGIELVLREGAAGEVYNVGGDDERDERRDRASRILELTGADESLIRQVEDRAGHDRRYSLDTAKLRAARLGASEVVRGGHRGDGLLVPGQSLLVGADQVRRVPRVLRAPVRRQARQLLKPPRLTGRRSSARLPFAAG